MKKFLTICSCLLCIVVNILANTNSNIWLDFNDQQLSVQQAVQQCQNNYDMPIGSDLVLTRTVEDNIGMTHYTYQQFVDGIKVEGCYLLVHVRGNRVTSINGRLLESAKTPQERVFSPRKQIKTKYHIAENDTLESLIFEYQGSYRSAYKYFDEGRFANIYLDSYTGEEIVAISIINYYDVQGTAKTYYYGNRTITYNCQNNINFLKDNARNITTCDASTFNGNSTTLKQFLNPNSKWPTPYIDSVTITWISQDWWYALTDATPDLYIKVKDLNGNVLYTSEHLSDSNVPVSFYIPGLVPANGKIQIEVLDDDGLGSDDSAGDVRIYDSIPGYYYTWSNSNTKARYRIWGTITPALDAHWGMEKVVDFYEEKFNRNGFDGNGSSIIQLINPPTANYSNSGFPHNALAYYSNGTALCLYGLGGSLNGSAYSNPWVAIDVVGHEFTHVITAANGSQNLPNSGEGGALNESFADIMGNAIEKYALGECDWLNATGVMVNTFNHANRSLMNPKSMGSPNTYQGTNWVTVTGNPSNNNDMDGVHTNCGVQNFWFYLLCQGGSGAIDNNAFNGSYSVTGIGMDKAIQIVYRNLLTYITSTSKYIDSRNGSIQAAIDLYGRGSQEHQSVVNAWHAVGVGSAYDDDDPETFQLTPGKYVIVANRTKSGDGNWYYMTSDLGTASNKRFQAVSTGTESMDAIVRSNLEDKYIWTLEADGNNWKLKNGTQYVTWTSGNSANLGSTAKSLTFEIADNQVQAHFNDGTNERYLALNATTGNNYFAFYSGTNQITYLFFLPYDDGTTPPPSRDCETVPFTESFASSQGDFSVWNKTLPSGFTSIWNWDAQYGMVAKCIKGSTKYESDSYLISPCIEIPENGNSVLTFSHAAKFFQNTSQMTLWISTNYDESNPNAATWLQLTIPNYPTGQNWNWFESGSIDLSAYKGQYVNIAFRYTSTTSYAPQWEIKNFAVKKASTTDVENVTMDQPNVTKILRDGQILILRGDHVYTLTGQEVQ